MSERAWLVEWRFNGVQWLYLWSSAPGGFSFTSDASKALRFARREDAEAALQWARDTDAARRPIGSLTRQGLALGEMLVTEHAWPTFTAAPSAQAEPVVQPDRFAPEDEALIRRAVLSYARDVLGDERNRAYRIAQVLRTEAQRREIGAQAEPQVPLTEADVFSSDDIRAVNADAQLGMIVLMQLVRAIERAHRIGKQEL